MAHTIPELLNDLTRRGWDAADLLSVHRAYDLACALFSTSFRGEGKPFVDHLVGTAGIAAEMHARPAVVTAGLLHAAYPLGEFGDGSRGPTPAKRAEVRAAVGDDAESLVACFHDAVKRRGDVLPWVGRVGDAPPEIRDVLLLRVANELDDHRDLGFRHRGMTPDVVADDPATTAMVTIAEELGHRDVAQRLRDAVDAEVAATVVVTAGRRPDHYTVAPRSPGADPG